MMPDLARERIAQNKNSKGTYLDLGNCGLTAIPSELRELVWLECLSFAGEWWAWTGKGWERRESQNAAAPNEWLVDLATVAGLNRLRELVAARTAITDLTPLAGLTALQTLDVSATDVRRLSEGYRRSASPGASLLKRRTVNGTLHLMCPW